MRRDFRVTYEIVTQESAEHGEADERGFISEGENLREAIADARGTRTCHCDGVLSVEADEYPMRAPRSVTISNGMEFLTGAYENRSLHIPDGITSASRRRIARLLGV